MYVVRRFAFERGFSDNTGKSTGRTALPLQVRMKKLFCKNTQLLNIEAACSSETVMQPAQQLKEPQSTHKLLLK
jgi:hypothetical protein